MRKLQCVILSLLIVLSLPIVACAKSYTEIDDAAHEEQEMIVHQVPEDDVHFADSESTFTLYGMTQSFIFDEAKKGILFASPNTMDATGGTCTLTIETCMWSPVGNPLEIGFFSLDTGTAYGYYFPAGGTITNETRYFDIPAGTYWLYVIDLGTTDITRGELRYSIS